MKRNLIQTLKIFIILTVICGLLYPLCMTGVGQMMFNDKANGSIVTADDGTKYGSYYLGQSFTQDKHLWGRPVSSDCMANDTFTSGDRMYYFAYPSNISPESEEFKAWVIERKEFILEHNPNQTEEIPSELIFQSGSGMDPQISYDTAMWQLDRLEAEWSGVWTRDEIIEFFKESSDRRYFGLFGDRLVNVLMVNLYLEGKLSI